jgi:hypothetical protein
MSSFYIENNVYVFNKTSYLNEEVSCTEPSSFVSFPSPTPQGRAWLDALLGEVVVGAFVRLS